MNCHNLNIQQHGMKKIFILLISIVIYAFGEAQTLKYVIFSGGSELTSIGFITDQKIIIKISQDGAMQEWGYDAEPGRFYSKPGLLQPYMGRVEYYGQQYDSAFRGKVKSIGTANITYYGSFEKADLAGKIKSIGNLSLDYYSGFDNEALRGKLKSAGTYQFTYFASYENEAYRGKIKSVGSNQLTYYSSFDDKLISGKIKSIGPYKYEWYTSAQITRYRGGLKSGAVNQVIEGVMYVIW